MNITIKISDQVSRAARHRAMDEGLSLSKWISDLIMREISRLPEKQETLLEALGNEELANFEVEFPRDIH